MFNDNAEKAFTGIAIGYIIVTVGYCLYEGVYYLWRWLRGDL